MKFSENSGVWTLCGLRRWRYVYRQASLCTVHITAAPMSASVTSICRHVAGHWYNRQQHVRQEICSEQGAGFLSHKALSHAQHCMLRTLTLSSPFCSLQVNGSRSHVQAPRPVPPSPSLPPSQLLHQTRRNESVVLLYPTKSRRKEAGRTSTGATARQLQRPLAASETSAPLVRQLQRPVERRTSPLALATGPCSDSFSAAMRARSASICIRAEREGEGERACVGVPYVI